MRILHADQHPQLKLNAVALILSLLTLPLRTLLLHTLQPASLLLLLLLSAPLRSRPCSCHRCAYAAVAAPLRAATLLQMVMNDPALRDAPPTRNPSMSGCVASSLQLPSFTEPP